MNNWPSVFASIIAILIGISTLVWATDRGQAWTAESARRLAIKKNPIELMESKLAYSNNVGDSAVDSPIDNSIDNPIDSAVNSTVTADGIHSSQQLILMEFIFTRCPTVCLAMGEEFRQLQEHLIRSGLQQQVNLLSISFDPKDKLIDLDQYLKRFSANSDIWSAAQFLRDEQLKATMHTLGAIAIPDPDFGYVHNTAVYAIKNNNVVAILDHDDRLAIYDVINRYTQSETNAY